MNSLNGVGLGLSVIFGCLFMALFAEMYYLLWRKRRRADGSSPARELLSRFGWKREAARGDLCNSLRVGGPEFLGKPLGTEEDVEEEWRRRREVSGPPRLLFTIVEETKEDLESEEGKTLFGKRKSLSEFLRAAAETPYLTPLPSPPAKPSSGHGFHPPSESARDAEFNRTKASPPPKFKFMQDAEEKLRKKRTEQGKAQSVRPSHFAPAEGDASPIPVRVDKEPNLRDPSRSPETRPPWKTPTHDTQTPFPFP